MASFHKNLTLFSKDHPLAAMWLQHLDCKGYRFLKSNLKTPFGLVYQNDVESWKKELPLQGAKVLYIFGVGLGLEYDALKPWLLEDQERKAIFFEPDPSFLKKFLSLEKSSEILKDPQVHIVPYFEGQKENELQKVFWDNILAPFAVVPNPYYKRVAENHFLDFKYKLEYDFSKKNALIEEYMMYGVPFFKNFYPNILKLSQSYFGNRLFDQFKGIPAILCGAGPSLEKQLPLLKTLKDKALIFAGGSAFNALASHGIIPHFGAGIDPNAMQEKRLDATKEFKVPFFYRTRIFAKALDRVQGEKLYISGTGGYDISKWFEEPFGMEEGFIDEGHNITNFCTELAERLGCHPILYIGVDLAFTGKKAYSSGVDKETENVVEKGAIEKPDIYGQPTLTLWKWIAESDWFSEFQKLHPESLLINCTEGGIGFEGISNIPFKEAAEKYLKKEYPLQQKIQEAIDKAKMAEVTEEGVKDLLSRFYTSILRSRQYLEVLKEEEDPISGKFALAESELQEEPAFRYLLQIFLEVYARVQSKKILHLKTPEEKKQLQRERFQFLQNVLDANKLLIEQVIK